jgi:hypothetical protein
MYAQYAVLEGTYEGPCATPGDRILTVIMLVCISNTTTSMIVVLLICPPIGTYTGLYQVVQE